MEKNKKRNQEEAMKLYGRKKRSRKFVARNRKTLYTGEIEKNEKGI